ncbi:MAG: AbrB/MazE/SpoVT family DNA-binding domain-containing protein [bacterium]|nr:AbrB/MazE/SpoVT family DNA-binding domain-containing protein [bacterium]
MRIVAFGGQYRVTLPKEIVKLRNWKKGTILRLVEDSEGNVHVKEIGGSSYG